jgi:hypothetical protein
MKYVLNGGPMDGHEVEVPYPHWLRLRVAVPDMMTVPCIDFVAEALPKPHWIPIADYRLVRYPDGRFGYEYDCLE